MSTPSPERVPFDRGAGFLQGAYYLVTGVWPIVSRESFEAVTGSKEDFWLVRTVGAIMAAVGATLMLSARRRRASSETAVLGLGTAAGFAAIDFVYGGGRRISAVYLVDGVAQLAIIAAHLRRRGSGGGGI